VAQVRWELAAHEDVRDIRDYIARDSRSAAAMVRRIRAAARRLARFPESGRAVPEVGDVQYRELIVGPYRLLYRYSGEENIVRVLAVIHGSQTLPPVRSRG
jgi:toxin ParE1/3/4